MTDQSALTRELDQKMVGPVVPDTSLPAGRRYLPIDSRKLLPSGQRREHELRAQTATPEVDMTHVTRRMEDLEAQHPHIETAALPSSIGPFEFDYLVDSLYTGVEGKEFTTLHGSTFNVYSTLTGAMAAAIITASTSLKKTILIVGNISEVPIDIAGMGTSAVIVIYGSDRYDTLITAASTSDIFIQTAAGGSGTGGRLLFRNIGLAPQSGYAVLYPTTNASVTKLEFEDCNFTQSGSYLVRQTGNTNLQDIGLLRIARCTGTLAGFYNTNSTSAAVAPNALEAYDNRLTITRWWVNSGSGNNIPQFTRVQGGYYDITIGGIALGGGANHQHWSSLNLLYGGGEPLFRSGTASMSGEDWTFQNIVIETEVADGSFADFKTATINEHKRIFIESIYGFSSATPSGIFIYIEAGSDPITDVYVGDIHAPQWPVVYSGPTITPAVPLALVVDHDDLTNVTTSQHHTKYTDQEARTAVPYAIEINFGWMPQSPQIFSP